jgi:hypothetical protein
MDKDLIAQTKNACDFIQKLYFEISYLIKEIEGMLQEEELVIGRPSGYGVSTRSSTGLEPNNVENWLPRSFTVFFCQKDLSKMYQGTTTTKIQDYLKVLIIHIELFDKEIKNPKITYALITDIVSKKPKWEKFEYLLSRFAYNGKKIFSNGPNIKYEDGYCTFRGKFYTENLFSINSSDELKKKIVDPMLELYRKA